MGLAWGGKAGAGRVGEEKAGAGRVGEGKAEAVGEVEGRVAAVSEVGKVGVGLEVARGAVAVAEVEEGAGWVEGTAAERGVERGVEREGEAWEAARGDEGKVEGREEVGWAAARVAAARVAGKEAEGKAGGWEEGKVAVRGVEKEGEV
jgi:hypothetical protein